MRLYLITFITQFIFLNSSAAEDIMLQVEDFKGPWRRQRNIRGYLGSGFCTSNANPKVASSKMAGAATVAKAGDYAVWVRAYTSSNSRRALQVEVAGKRLAVTHKGGARGWRWERAGEVALSAGSVQIIVHDADVGFESADAILITDRKDYDPMAEERQWLVYGEEIPDRADALKFNIAQCSKRLAKLADPKDAEEWKSRRRVVRRELARALGLDPLPPRLPLNARVTGRTDRELYTIENVVIESRPRFYVTANLYIPRKADLPAPAIVVVPGHAMKEGKNYPAYQMAQIGFARQGFVVLAYDPIGQGERRRPGFSHTLGYSLLLVGQTNEGVITWDTIRAIDYLCTRPEVDANRIGLTGNSGGGENTFYATPFDTRIKAAASFCFVCSYEQWIRHGGNHCICNHLPGIVRKMEQFEIIGLDAPRPFMLGNGAKDPIFPIKGTRETFRRAKRIYDFYDGPEKIAQVEAPLPHGWAQPLREAAYGWMARWLQKRGNAAPIPEEDYKHEAWNSKALKCFKTEKMPKDAETLVTLASKLGERFIQGYSDPPTGKAQWKRRSEKLRRDIWETFGGKPERAKLRARKMGSFTSSGRLVEKIALAAERGMEVPALLIWPERKGRPCPCVIFLAEDGKAAVRNSPLADRLLREGVAVFAFDPRALGEVEVHDNHVASDAICLGRPILAQQVWDVIRAAEYIAGVEGIDPKRVACYGSGASGLHAVFAAALSEGICAVAVEETLASYLYAIENSQPQPLWIFVPNILKVADIPQAAALVSPRPVLFANPVGFGRRPLSKKAATEKLSFTRSVFAVVEAEENLRIVVGRDDLVSDEVFSFLDAQLR